MRLQFLVTLIVGVAAVTWTCQADPSQDTGKLLLEEAKSLRKEARSRPDLLKAEAKFKEAIVVFDAANEQQSKAKAMRETAYMFADFGDRITALRYLFQTLDIYRRLQDDFWTASTLGTIGMYYGHLHQYQKALEVYQDALSIRIRRGETERQVSLLKDMAMVYLQAGNFAKQNELLVRALDLMVQPENLRDYASFLSNKAHLMGLLNRRPEAVKLLEEEISVRQKLGDTTGEAWATECIAWNLNSMGDFEGALDFYNKALDQRAQLKQEKNRANIYKKMADSCRSLRDYPRATKYLQQRLEIERNARDEIWEAFSLADLGDLYRSWGRYEESLAYYHLAREIEKRRGNLPREALWVSGMASVNIRLGKFEEALRLCEESKSLSRKADNLLGEAQSYQNAAFILKNMGRYQSALRSLDESLELRERVGNFRAVAQSLKAIGGLYRDRGQYRQSLSSLNRALELEQEIGCTVCQTNTLKDIGSFYESLGDHQNALIYLEKSLTIGRDTGFFSVQQKQEGQTLAVIGTVYASMGDQKRALEFFQKAITLLHGEADTFGGVLDQLAHLHMDMGELERAETLVRQSKNDLAHGRYHLLRSNLSDAERYYIKSLHFGEQSGNVDILFSATTGLGRVCEELNDLQRAESYYRQAVTLSEDMRARLLPSERGNFFDARIGGFRRSEPAKGLTRVLLKLGRPEDSVESGEFIRARSLADQIAQSSVAGLSSIPRELSEQETELVTRIANLKKALQETSRETERSRTDSLSREIKEAEEGLNKLVNLLWKDHRTYAASRFPRPLRLEQVEVSPDEHIVLYDILGKGIGIRLIKGRDVVQSLFKPIDERSLEKDVQDFRMPFESLSLGDFRVDLGRKLYELLLEDVINHVPANAPLVIIPDGILSVLPFEALVVSGDCRWKNGRWGAFPSGLTYLGDRHPVSYQQSLTALTLGRTIETWLNKGAKILVVADPVFQMAEARAQSVEQGGPLRANGEFYSSLMHAIEEEAGGRFKFERLPGTGDLASKLSRLFAGSSSVYTGLQANKELFLNEIAPRLSEYSWVVIATHGLMGNTIPGLNQPFLALSMIPPGTDGFLKLTDIVSLRMSAQLVALTACQTGLGRDISGEGVMSMGRAFQYAGARAVLMSLWSVAEESSVMLVERVFSHLKAGRTKLESLRRARDEIRNVGYEHPFFWSPFILVGEVN